MNRTEIENKYNEDRRKLDSKLNEIEDLRYEAHQQFRDLQSGLDYLHEYTGSSTEFMEFVATTDDMQSDFERKLKFQSEELKDEAADLKRQYNHDLDDLIGGE